ncbi:hypothetical protein Tsubulata_036693 [Turnera subulata]|uniref:Uncharacterized protein n=1 Tax=Turnera subulata TaxID=218843 RepID=A0A9Q0J2X6_9ROSI|nr:hypothetical protein Tsubulata_036693 [Turnera subulata]
MAKQAEKAVSKQQEESGKGKRGEKGLGFPTRDAAIEAAILQNRVAPAERLHALILAECMVSIWEEEWLIGHSSLPDDDPSLPVDRCLLLVFQSSRVEVAALLNELAYLKYDANNSPDTSTTADHQALSSNNEI